jgi:hypothetical protein
MMILILERTNLCPRECEYYRVEPNEDPSEYPHEYCHLPDGTWALRIKQEQLIECPLGKWNLKAEMGFGPQVL